MNQETPHALVVGWPIKHSRSPLIHRYWLQRYGIEGDYDRRAVEPGGFAACAATIGTDGLRGANVTVPHKETAFTACDRLTDAAERIGAVNTLWREAGALWGDNTDAAGFRENLDEEAPGWREHAGRAVVLGAGGAARAILYSLLQAGVESITLVNRTSERAAALASAFGSQVNVANWADLPSVLKGAEVLVNTTSAGMVGAPSLELDLSPLPQTALVADIVYIPLQTPLLVQAEMRGLRTVGGLGMLLHQAVSGFERWFGVRPAVTPELRALLEADVLESLKGA